MGRYTIVPHRTQVFLDQGTSHHAIEGEAHRVTGVIAVELAGNQLDLSKPVSGRFEVPVTRFTSGNSIYDREMHRVIDSRRYPTISGELTSIEALDPDGRYLLKGALTFHGVTHDVQGEIRVSSPNEDTLIVEGSQTFDVRAWGVQPPTIAMRLLAISADPTVTVRVRIAAEREKEDDAR